MSPAIEVNLKAINNDLTEVLLPPNPPHALAGMYVANGVSHALSQLQE